MTAPHYTRMDKPAPTSRNFCLSVFITGCSLFILTVLTVYFWKASGADSSVVVANGASVQIYPPPPPHTEYARVARYIIHVSDWASLATESSHPGILGYPFANVFSISDGTFGNSSGTPYFYLTSMELSVHDIEKNPRASLTATLAQSSYCKTHHLDPQDPLCAHVILTGEMVKVVASSAEERFAREALFKRHPEMNDWPSDHDWFFARLALRHIYLLDYFGGAKVVTPQAYYSASPL